MRPIEVPTSKAKLKLLSSAESLVALRGFDAVSVRDVTQKAKANVAAINYHFGSRKGMMDLLMLLRMSPIHEEQLSNLNLLEKKRGSKAVPVEELLEAWLKPMFLGGKEAKKTEDVALRSVARILQVSVAELPEALSLSGAELWKRYLKAFGKTLKDFPAQEIAWRLHLINGSAVQSLIGTEPIHEWAGVDNASSSIEQRLSRLLLLAAPMMREGGVKVEEESKPKGPQSTFDF